MLNLVETLTKREREVYELILTGASNQEIADTFNFTLSMAKKHSQAIYVKLGVFNRTGAVAYGYQARNEAEADGTAPHLTPAGEAYTEEQIRQAARMVCAKVNLSHKKAVNEFLVELLAALGGKYE